VVAKVDLDAIKAAGKQTPMIVIITNMGTVGLLKFKIMSNEVDTNSKILTATTK